MNLVKRVAFRVVAKPMWRVVGVVFLMLDHRGHFLSRCRRDGLAELHLEDPELFAAYLKVLNDLVCKLDTARDIQNVQIMAPCR